MIVPITIDTAGITSQFDVSKEQVDTMMNNIAKSLAMVYMSKLETEVSNSLHSTRRRYLQNIRMIDSGPMEATVLLDYSKDPLVKAIEEGSGPTDLKTGLLMSPKAKISKTGKRYITVPMRWSTPGAVGESEMFGNQLPQDVYDIVSKGGPTKLSDLPSQYQTVQSRKEIKSSEGKTLFDQYTHKTALHSGITKQTDNVTGQSTYFSFRRVSENSDPNAFIHPGIMPRNFIDKAFNSMNLEQEVGIQIDKELAKIGF